MYNHNYVAYGSTLPHCGHMVSTHTRVVHRHVDAVMYIRSHNFIKLPKHHTQLAQSCPSTTSKLPHRQDCPLQLLRLLHRVRRRRHAARLSEPQRQRCGAAATATATAAGAVPSLASLLYHAHDGRCRRRGSPAVPSRRSWVGTIRDGAVAAAVNGRRPATC